MKLYQFEMNRLDEIRDARANLEAVRDKNRNLARTVPQHILVKLDDVAVDESLGLEEQREDAVRQIRAYWGSVLAKCDGAVERQVELIKQAGVKVKEAEEKR